MRRLFLSLLVVAIVGCDRSIAPLTLAPTDTTVAGSYGLVQVNGHSLPIVDAVRTNTSEYDLTSDRMIISTGGTWSETTSYNVISLSTNAVSQLATVTSGTYTVGAGVITFTRLVGDPATFTGSVTGNTLSLLFLQVLSVYSR